MPMLYTSPHFVALDSAGKPVGGATLTFSATGTSTLQNIYQDIALTTPHLNPVSADANGVFPLIYLDPSLPDYRITLKDSGGAQLDQQDNIPSNENTAQTIRLKSTAPELIFEETDASADNKKWRIRVNNGSLFVELLNDAESVTATLLELDRSGMTPTTVLAAVTSGAFFGALTGVASGSGDIAYTVINNWCTLRGSIAGTSNSTALTLVGLPVFLRPTGNVSCACLLTDNGATTGGWAFIAPLGSTISFGKGFDDNLGSFTNSGSKGLSAGWTIGYPLT